MCTKVTWIAFHKRYLLTGVENPRTETGSPQHPAPTSCVLPCPRRRMCKVCVSIIKMKWSCTPLEPGSSTICCLVHTERDPKVSGSVFPSQTPASWRDGVREGNIAGSPAPSASVRPIVPRLRLGSRHRQPLAGATRHDLKVLLVQAGRGEGREIQQDR